MSAAPPREPLVLVVDDDAGSRKAMALTLTTDGRRVEEFADAGIEDRQREIAARHGFELTDHSLTLRGRCVRERCPHRSKQV